jgi:hypothetical protein
MENEMGNNEISINIQYKNNHQDEFEKFLEDFNPVKDFIGLIDESCRGNFYNKAKIEEYGKDMLESFYTYRTNCEPDEKSEEYRNLSKILFKNKSVSISLGILRNNDFNTSNSINNVIEEYSSRFPNLTFKLFEIVFVSEDYSTSKVCTFKNGDFISEKYIEDWDWHNEEHENTLTDLYFSGDFPIDGNRIQIMNYLVNRAS